MLFVRAGNCSHWISTLNLSIRAKVLMLNIDSIIAIKTDRKTTKAACLMIIQYHWSFNSTVHGLVSPHDQEATKYCTNSLQTTDQIDNFFASSDWPARV